MAKKVIDKVRSVILCSGGFDSVCLAHYVNDMLTNSGADEEIHILFFDYGQRNLKMERQCSKTVAEKLQMKWYEIHLPKMLWTNGDFYSNKYKGENGHYLEFRNFIFLAYAFSYAESIGASEIYTGFFRYLDGEPFIDASPEFVEIMNLITPEIKVYSPFLGGIKNNLKPLVKYYGITKSDFFSCDYPVDNKPCGKCLDCQAISEIFGE